MTEVIAALDFDQEHTCLSWVDKISPQYCVLKIGSVLFARCGPQLVQQCISRGFRVFLDLKFHDIPNTVSQAAVAAADMGVWMLNVHAMGGMNMLTAARTALEPFGSNRPLLTAVTVLTSHDELGLVEIGITRTLDDQVKSCAQMAFDAGLDGVVCSGWEAAAIKKHFGKPFLTVTPGIRMSGDQLDDQARVLTPLMAKKQGSDYIVMGRSLTRIAEPASLLKQLYEELNSD